METNERVVCVEKVMKLTCLKLYPHECEVGKHKYELQIRIMLSETKAQIIFAWGKFLWVFFSRETEKIFSPLNPFFLLFL